MPITRKNAKTSPERGLNSQANRNHFKMMNLCEFGAGC